MEQPKILRPIIKCHGGKRYLAKWLISHFPKDFEEIDYCEVFGGGGSVLLNKLKSKYETLNDIDSNLTAIWHCVKHDHERFIESLREWSYTEESFNKAKDMVPGSCFDKAIKEYVLRRMSRGGMKKSFAWSKRLRNGKPGDVNAWETMLDHIPDIHQRIKEVTILPYSFEEILNNLNNANTFFYLDPPYMKSTRTSTNIYDHEMTDKQHEILLDLCLESKAKIMISGYQCPLYNKKLRDWNFHYRAIANHSSQASRKTVKLECLWHNYS